MLNLGYYGVALLFTQGGNDRVARALPRAIELAEALDDVDAQLRALWVLWNVQLGLGECTAAIATADRFYRVASRTGDPADVLVGDRLMAQALHYSGRLHESEQCFARVLDRYVTPGSERHAILFMNDQAVLARTQWAEVLLLRGFADPRRRSRGGSEPGGGGGVAARDHALLVAAAGDLFRSPSCAAISTPRSRR